MANFDIRMDLQGDILKSMRAVSSQMKGMQKQTKNLGSSWKNITKGVLASNVITKASSMIVSGAREAIKVFDDSQHTFQAFSDTTGLTLKKFRKTMVDTSIATGASMGEVNNVLSAIATKTGDSKFAVGIVKSLSELQVATGASGEAIGNVASMFTQAKISGEDSSKYLNILYSVGKYGSFTMKEMSEHGTEAFKSMSHFMGSLDEKKMKDFAVATQMVQQQTGNAAETGTVMRQAYDKMKFSTATKYLKQYHVSLKDANGATRNLMDVFKDLHDHGMSDEEAKKMLGIRGVKMYTASYDKATLALKKQLDALKTYNDLHKDAKANTQTFEASLNRLSAAFTGALLPALTPIVSLLASFSANMNPEIIMGVVAALGAYVAVTKTLVVWEKRAAIWKGIVAALDGNWAGLAAAAAIGGGVWAYSHFSNKSKVTPPKDGHGTKTATFFNIRNGYDEKGKPKTTVSRKEKPIQTSSGFAQHTKNGLAV